MFRVLFVLSMIILSSCNSILKKPNLQKDGKTILKLRESLRAHSVLSYDSWVKDKPEVLDWKFRAAKVYDKDVSFQVGIYDKNKNGKFGDTGSDMIFLTRIDAIDTEFSSGVSSSVARLKRKNIVRVDESYYEVRLMENDLELEISSIETPTATIEDVRLITKLPPLILLDFDGNPFDLSQIPNDKPILLDFWATYCASCMVTMDAYKDNGILDKYHVISLLGNDDLSTAIEIVDQLEFDWTFLVSRPKINRLFNANGYPYEVVIDKNRFIHYGVRVNNTP